MKNRWRGEVTFKQSATSSTQTLQPSASAPTTIVSSTGTLKGSEFHWSGVLLAVGLLSISGAVTAFIIKVPVQYNFLLKLDILGNSILFSINFILP